MRYLLIMCLLGIGFSISSSTSAQSDACGNSTVQPELITWDASKFSFEEATLGIAGYLDAGIEIDAASFDLAEIDSNLVSVKVNQFEANITGDEQSEIFVNVTFHGSWSPLSDGFWAVYECQNENYEVIFVQSFRSYDVSAELPPGVIAVEDLTDDGIPEVVFYHVTDVGTHFHHMKQIQIYEWNSNERIFNPMLPTTGVAPYNQMYAATIDIRIEDTTHNGIPEILAGVNHVNYYNSAYVLPRDGYQVWEWQGLFFTNWCEIFPAEPIYRIQALQDAGSYFDCRRYEDALAMYERVLTDDELLGADGAILVYSSFSAPSEDEILTAYTHYRRMLLYIILEDIPSATTEYKTLQNWSGAGLEYVELATIFWEQYFETDNTQLRPEDFLNACGSVNFQAEEKGIDSPFVVYPFTDGGVVTEVLCPFKQFAPISD